MGQQASREHAPLTFGYVKHATEDDHDIDETLNVDEDNNQPKIDFVLANPQLYQLQALCKQCHSLPAKEVIVSSLIGESCSKCQKQKRLSLVKKDLADDLDYIDQTYYPDLIHYNNSTIFTTDEGEETESTDPMEVELLQLEKDNLVNQQLSRLTIGEATHSPGAIRRKPRRLTGPSMAVDLSNRLLIKLDPSIGFLDGLTKLNLSNNQMTSLPRELGYLKNLRMLNVSNNLIDELPDTVSFLTKLKALNVSHNNLVQLPATIGHLPKLVIIIANNNRLTSLPREFAHLVNLISLNVSSNPLKCLPAEIASIKSLRKLLTDDCAFEEEYEYNLRHDPPSLFETCARIAIRSEVDIPSQLADHIKDYLARANTCSHCNGPFFDSYVTRVRYIERRVRQPLALEYTLCSAHWSNESDRLLAMFSHQPIGTSVKHKHVDMNGLNDEMVASRSRAYSDLTPTMRRVNSNSANYPPTADYFPISSLRNQPNLPALPQQDDNSLLQPPKGNRQRASSSASVTKRFTNFIRSNSGTVSRARSNSGSSTTSLSSVVAPPKRTNLREWSEGLRSEASITVSGRQDRIQNVRHNTAPLETI